MLYTKLSDVQEALFAGKITLEQLVQSYLQRIEDKKSINAFVEVFAEEALEQARILDAKHKSGAKMGSLFGMVLGIKDNICYKNHAVSASSKILQNYTSPFSATAVERLLEEDVIIIGRLSCDEFAMGSSNEKSFYGAVKNPLDETRVPGGSSGGSAAAVAAHLCLASLGSDTGGSIRQPASFCGNVGFKPTYGRISRYGLLAYGSSFDQIGPIAHSVEDAELLYLVMAGKDKMDSTSSSKELSKADYSTGKKFKLAIFDTVINNPALQPEVKQSFDTLIEKLKSEGHQIDVVQFPYLDYLVPTYYVLTTAEASSNLSRYDGIHFGYRSPNATDLESTYLLSRSEGFGKEVKRRIMLGTFVLSSGYYDAYYTKAQKVRNIITSSMKSLLSEYDFVLSPTTPGTAFKFGEKSLDPVSMYLEDIFTVLANIVGMPAISIPFGQDQNAMPIGMQFMANQFKDHTLFEVAHQIA